MLRLGLVHRDDGVGKRLVVGHGAQANDTGRGLFGTADDMLERLAAGFMDAADHVGAIVHSDLRAEVDDGVHMAVVRFGVLAFQREHGNAVVFDERCGSVILGGQRVGSAQAHVRAACLERAHEICRFGGHVQAGANAHALERTFALETLANACKHGHVAVCPQNAVQAVVGQLDVLDVIFHVERILSFAA